MKELIIIIEKIVGDFIIFFLILKILLHISILSYLCIVFSKNFILIILPPDHLSLTLQCFVDYSALCAQLNRFQFRFQLIHHFH